MNPIIVSLLGSLGALASVGIAQWERFGKMSERRFKAQFTSFKNWAAIIFLVVIGGLSAWFLTYRIAEVTPELAFFAGLGAMSITRQFISGLAANQGKSLGPTASQTDDEDVKWGDVF